jgi:TP901 family phage tail tape measure protein
MARTTADLDIKITASGLEKMIQELTKAQEGLQKLGTQYKGASNSAKLMNDIITDGNKALSLIKTKMSSDGTMDLASARSLTDILQRITNQTMELDKAEKQRLSPEKYKAQHEALVENNADYQKILKTLEKLNAQQTLLQDKKNNLEKGDANLVFQELGIKGSAGAKKVLPKISSLTDKQLNNLIPSDNARESTKEAFYNKYRVGKESNEIVRSNVKSAIEVELKRRQEIKRISLEQIEIEKKITAHSAERATHEQKIEALKKEGITTAPGMAKYTEQFFSTSKAINDATVAASNANKSVVQLDSSVANNTSTFQQATKAILSSRMVYNTLRRVLNETIRTVREMDKALTGMTAVTGKTREEVHKLIPELKKLAQETSSTMTDVANLTTEYLRQGRSMEDALELAKETAKAAQIAEISTSDSLTYMTSAINGFNLAASDAAHVSDVFANVAAKTATDYEQLAVALSKVSAQANLAGISMEYTTALLAKGIETTQEAPESIGTALKTIIARMRELTDYNKVLEDGSSISKVERALASAGIALRDQNGAFRDLEQIFNELGPKWETLNTMQQQAIAQAIAGTRQQSRFVAIMQDWERTMESVTIAEESAGAASYQYSKMAEGLTATLTNLTTSWQGFTTSLIDTDFLISILRTATELLNTLSNATPFLRNIMVIGGAIAGYTKLSNMYAEQSYIKNLQIAALKKQIGGVEIHNAKSLKKQLIIERAKLGILEAESLAYNKQKLVVDALEVQQKTLLANKAQALAMDIQILRSKQSELTYENYVHLLSSNSLLTKAAILRLNQENLKATIDAEVAEVAQLKTDWAQAEAELQSLMINEEITEEKKQQEIAKKQGNIESLKGNIAEKEELLLLKQQTLEKNKQMKKDLKNFGKRAGAIAAIAAAIVGIVIIIKQMNKLIKVQENALKSIEEHSNNIYELNNKSNDLTDLIDQYQELYNKVVRTKEEEEKLLELEKQLQEQKGVSGTGSALIASATAVDIGYKVKIAEEQDAMISDTLKAFRESSEKIDFFKNSTFENAFKRKYEMQIDTNLEKEMAKAVAEGIITMEQYNYAKSTGKRLLQSIDSTSVAQQA